MKKKYFANYEKKDHSIEFEEKGSELHLTVDGKSWVLDVVRAGSNHYSVIHEGRSYDLRFFHKENQSDAFWNGEHLGFELEDARSRSLKKALGKGGPGAIEGPVEITAPMPGKIVAVKVKVGDVVEEGQGVLVLEAMKMENELASPKKGIVKEVKVKEAQSVESNAILVVIE